MVRFVTKKFLGINVVDTDYDNFVSTIMGSSGISDPINIMSVNLTSLKRFDKRFDSFIKESLFFQAFIGFKISDFIPFNSMGILKPK